MYLLDLPLDVFRKVLQQTVITLGAKSARRLRVLNSMYGKFFQSQILAYLIKM